MLRGVTDALFWKMPPVVPPPPVPLLPNMLPNIEPRLPIELALFMPFAWILDARAAPAPPSRFAMLLPASAPNAPSELDASRPMPAVPPRKLR